MQLKSWESLPQELRKPEVYKYYKILQKKEKSLFVKRVMDVVLALTVLIILSPFMFILSALIVVDSKGGVFYRQERVTAYGKVFRIHKFRTMVKEADKLGAQITVESDPRITRIGKFLRKYRLDELPQVIDVLEGSMSFVGTRPEVPKYVLHYTNEMKATLLLRAGITSEASILYKDEDKLLKDTENAEEIYIKKILPKKMKYNLRALRRFSLWNDVRTMVWTVFAVVKRDKKNE